MVGTGYVENKAGLTGQTVPGRRIPGHWPYPGPEELAEAEPVGPDACSELGVLLVNQRLVDSKRRSFLGF